MSAVGFTPIQLYYSTTPGAQPIAARLLPGELAINIKDGKLYYEDDTGTVRLLASTTAAAGNITTGTGTNITGLLKGNGTTISAAVPKVDYAPKTTGSNILAGDGSGGFSEVTIGAGLAYVGGVLSNTGGGGGGGGDVIGPPSSVNNTIARFDGTSGKVIEDGPLLLFDNGDVEAVMGAQLMKFYFRNTAWQYYDNGTSFSFNYGFGSVQKSAPTGSVTFSVSNWPLLNQGFGELLIEGVNLAGATIDWDGVLWVKPDGSYTTDFDSLGTPFTGGVDWVLLWTRDGGSTVYGKVIR